MNRVILALFLTLALVASMVGCGQRTESTPPPENDTETDVAAEQPPESELAEIQPWQIYGNDGVLHTSGVTRYRLGENSVWIEFADGSQYEYTPNSCGQAHYDNIRSLAIQGEGLTTYFGNNHGIEYEVKLDGLNASNSYSYYDDYIDVDDLPRYAYSEVECPNCGCYFEAELEVDYFDMVIYDDDTVSRDDLPNYEYGEVECPDCGTYFEIEIEMSYY